MSEISSPGSAPGSTWTVNSPGSAFNSRVARRFAYLTVLCSTVLAFFLTGLQLALDYNSERGRLTEAIEKIELTLLPSVAESLWLLDTKLLDTQLNGIINLPGVVSALVEDGENTFQTGSLEAEFNQSFVFPIVHDLRGGTRQIGTLHVRASFAHIIDQLVRRSLVVLGTNFLKTMIVAFAILIIYRRLIGRHLSALAQFADNQDPGAISERLVLDLPTSIRDGAEDDELVLLESSINGMVEANEAHIQKLNQANSEQADFTYAISHDLKSPSNTIAMLIDEAEECLVEGEPLDGILGDIKKTNKRMGKLVEDVLDYSRVVEVEPEFEPVELNVLLKEVVEDLAGAVSEAKAQIVWDKLPLIYGHPHQMRILFQNLIANSIKFREPDRPPVINIAHRRAESSLTITVTDNGIGIPEIHRERVFGLFNRLHARSRYDGTGLGLTVCKRIVSKHGGTIRIDAAEGGGTTMTMEFGKDVCG